jgi:hypothetical protein
MANTVFAFIPLFCAAVFYKFLPEKIPVPSSIAGMGQWGEKGNVFVFPIFCIIAWFVCWIFIKVNRIREHNEEKLNNRPIRSIETYYVWASWAVDIISLLAVLYQGLAALF